MEHLKRWVRNPLRIAMTAVALALPLAGQADEVDAPEVLLSSPAVGDGDGYGSEGAGDCMTCHDETEKYPVVPILATPHGVTGDARTPLAQEHGCETCHGPSAAHMDDETQSPAILFGLDAPVGPQTDVCMGCHKGGNRMNWRGSTHDSMDIPCAGCHTIHTKEQAVLTRDIRPGITAARGGQTQVCFGCHQVIRAQTLKSSSHPIREGLVQCSDCHSSHGSMGPNMVVAARVNETCYRCHAEKRGPFLWEHAPAREDCTNCHDPHGSSHPTLLKLRVPQLCKQCHNEGYHPSEDYTGPFPAGGVADFHQVAKGCLNCHTEVHGSNHPSGPRFTR